MEEIIFIATKSLGEGYVAKGSGVSIFTQGDTLKELKELLKDAVVCHFNNDKKRRIRLFIVREEIITG